MAQKNKGYFYDYVSSEKKGQVELPPLIELFALQPGPEFLRILDGLQEAQVEGEVKGREQALLWVERRLQSGGVS